MRFRRREYNELASEIRQHIEEKIEELQSQGIDRNEAERIAASEFGNITQIRERSDAIWRWPFLESICADLGYTARQIRKAPALAAMIIATLALGIGVNTAIFSIVDAVLLKPLPYPNASRMVVIWQTDATHRQTGGWFNAYREFEAWRQESHSFESLSAITWDTRGSTLLWRGKASSMLAIPATVDFFSMLQVPAQIGRTFAPSDLKEGCTLVASHRFWQDHLGGERDIVNLHPVVDRTSCQVVGVMPTSFSFYPVQTDAWLLITPESSIAREPWESMAGVFGVLKPGVTRAAAEAELKAIQTPLLPEVPAQIGALRNLVPDVLNLQSNFIWLAGRNLEHTLWAVFAAAGLLMLMACLNIANLLLGRGFQRSQEMAIRASLGSARSRLFQQLSVEALLLSFAGAAGGILLAFGILRWFAHTNAIELPPGNVISLDWRVAVFAALLGIVAAVLFGALPAWRGSRTDLSTILKTAAPGSGGSLGARRTSHALIALQVGLSLALLTGAGLLADSLRQFISTPLGYRTDHVLTAQVNLAGDRYDTAQARLQLRHRLSDQISALPNVRAVAEASGITPSGEKQIAIPGEPRKQGSEPYAAALSVGNSYFQTLQIPILRGRQFDTRQRPGSQPVVIVNEAFVRKYLPHTEPLGSVIKFGAAEEPSRPWLTIVGVCANVKTTTVFQEMGYIETPIVYRPLVQDVPQSLAFLVVTSSDPQSISAILQRQLTALDPELALGDVETMEARQHAALAPPRFRAILFGGFSLLALLLAAIGIHGLLTQTVIHQTRAIGIRMALGASGALILRTILGRMLLLVAVGIAIGAAASIAVLRLIASLLYLNHASNSLMFLLAAAAVLASSILAACVPAWRAAAVDPVQALRSG